MSPQPPRTLTILPRFEGSNIGCWIGFKHIMYLLEEAILQDFRARGSIPRRLYEDHGLCLEIVSSSVRILHSLYMDDEVSVEITPRSHGPGGELRYKLALWVERGGRALKIATGTVAVLLRRDAEAVVEAPSEAVRAMLPHTVDRIEREPDGLAAQLAHTPALRRGDGEASGEAWVPVDESAVVWAMRIPYFHCHFGERIQHSGYLRILEEIVDKFLADRGISIRTMLDRHRWIPAVPNAKLDILREAYMEETLLSVFRLDSIFKRSTYTATIDCYVERDGELVHTATGTITHAYAVLEGRARWSVVEFDDATLAALSRPR